MNDLWKTNVGKHTIRIVRLKRDELAKSSVLVTGPTVRIYGTSPCDVQYQGEKRKMLDACAAAAKWASKLDISTVGGPILSGALLAEGIAAHSERLLPFYIAKKPGYYRPYKHEAERVRGIFRGKYIIVDDIICTGNSMEIALGYVKSYNGDDLEGLEAILSFSGGFRVSVRSHPLLVKLTEEGKAFGLYCSKRRRS